MKKKKYGRLTALLVSLCLLLQMAPAAAVLGQQTTFVGVDTMMIYNPAVDSSSTMSTGSLVGQINTQEGNFNYVSDGEEDYFFLDQGELYEELEGIDLSDVPEDDSLSLQATDYGVGDTRDFFVQPEATYKYQYTEFTCLYSGTYCRVWGAFYDDTDIAEAMGREFDQIIYPGDTEAFGTARYIQDGDKLNILIYPMYSTGLCGFFRPIELLTAAEMGSSNAQRYNNSMPIIHVNSFHCSAGRYQSTGLVTIAHEYQHLICMSSTLLGNGRTSLTLMGTWLNESMAAAAEEWIYPGEMTELGYISRNYNGSGLISGGQSLYDFTTSSGDIGVYGQALLFSEYLKKQCGEQVFHGIHDYWRSAPANSLTDADALYSVIPEDVQQAIDSQLTYGSSIENLLSYDEQKISLSKLNLAFQLAVALQEPSGIYSMTDVCSEASPKFYTGSGRSIEGGGRLFVRTKNGQSFTVPTGADSRLIYVGFKDGEMVVPPTTAADYDPTSPYKVTAVSNDESMGTVSCYDVTITASPAAGYGYAVPAATVISGEATVVRSGDVFTVSPSSDCTIQINFAPAASGAADTWDGTAEEPVFSEGAYYIHSAEQLAGLAQMVNEGNTLANTDVHLMADLDLSGHQWTPIGSYAQPFSGRFYGNDHIITGLTVGSADTPYNSSCAGLFGRVQNADKTEIAKIMKLTIQDAVIYGNVDTGILGGYIRSGYISDCQTSGTVSGSSAVGGLAGAFGSGDTSEGTITMARCFSSATITSSGRSAGGLLGTGDHATVTLCGATGDVTSGGSDVGGLVGGDSYSEYSDCYATGDVEGTYYIGGLTGYPSSSDFTSCYAAGGAKGDNMYVGSLLGAYNGSSYGTCYSNCEKTLFPIGGQGAGYGMLTTEQLKKQSSYNEKYWDFDYTWIITPYANEGFPILRWQTKQAIEVVITAEKGYLTPGETLQLSVSLEPSATADQAYTLTSSTPEVASVSDTGLVTAHQTGATVITAKAAKGGAVGTFRILVMEENDVAAGFGGGSGTAEDPFLVATVGHLEHLAAMVNYGYDFAGKEILQVNDLELRGSAENPWTPIGSETAPFRGSYNGNCHTISGLYVKGTGNDPVGLFGAAEDATIACLDIKDSTFQGGVVGAVAGCITDCGLVDCCTLDNVTVTVTAESGSAGGIVGMAVASDVCQIGFCSSQAQVSSPVFDGRIGGIIGSSTGRNLQVVACRSSGPVTYVGEDTIYVTAGGILGYSGGGYVIQCFSTADVKCGDRGYSGGIVGASKGSTTIQSCYATGEMGSGETSVCGGIISQLYSGDVVQQCYFTGSYGAGNFTRTPIALIVSYGTINQCYYLNSSGSSFNIKGTTSLTSAQMKQASSFSGWDFSKTWGFVEGENSGYPVLKVFYPTWDGNAPTFDRAAFSEGCQDVTVTFDRSGNVLEGVQGLTEDQYKLGEYDSQSNVQTLTIRKDFLMTLGVGTQTLTAEFGADCQVEFQINVVDNTPTDRYIFALDGFTPAAGGQAGSVDVLISAPKDGRVVCVAALYDGEKMKDAGTKDVVLSKGANVVTLDLDGTEGETCKLFLLEGGTWAPLAEHQEETLSAPAGQRLSIEPDQTDAFLAWMGQMVP